MCGRRRSSQPGALDAAIAAGKPELLATIGFGGFLVILFLMVFKPF